MASGSGEKREKLFSDEKGEPEKLVSALKTIQAKSVWNYIILHAHNPAGAEEAEEKMLALTGKKTISITLPRLYLILLC